MKWYFVLAILIGIQLAESEITFQELEVEVKNILRGEEELRSKAFPKEMQDIFKMTEFTKLNNELKQIALEELAYFEENGIDIRKLHRFVNNREGYKTTKDILVDYSAVLLIFASIPYVASLETSFFNSLKRSTVHGILKINEKDLKWCENQEHGTTFYRLSYTTNQKSPPDCTGMAYHPFDASHTFNQLFHSLLLKADDFKEGESRPSYPWLKTMYDQMSIKYPSLDHKVMPELLMEMFKESCEQGISHHRYKVVAGSYGMPLVYNRGTEQSTNLLDVFNHTLTQFNEWSGEEGTKLRSKCGPRFTADIVWVVYSGILWKKCPEILQKFNNEVIQAKNKGLGHLIAAMDVLGDQYYIGETQHLKKFPAHNHACDIINGVKDAEKPFLGSFPWNLFPLKDTSEDNAYDMYLAARYSETPYLNQMGFGFLYPKIMADLMEKSNEMPVNVCPLNLHYLHNIDLLLLKFLHAHGVPTMIQGCDEGLNGRRLFHNYYYAYLNTFDLRTVISSISHSISHSGLLAERKQQLMTEFLDSFRKFVMEGSKLLSVYNAEKKQNRQQRNQSFLMAPRPFAL